MAQEEERGLEAATVPPWKTLQEVSPVTMLCGSLLLSLEGGGQVDLDFNCKPSFLDNKRTFHICLSYDYLKADAVKDSSEFPPQLIF